MAAIDEFITNARDKGIDEEIIRQALEKQGWDVSTITLALAGISAPRPDAVNSHVLQLSQKPTESIHPLLAALHHVLLWVFIVASTIAIGAVVSSLFGESVDSKSLAAMIAVVVITFTPYAVLYLLFLRKLRSQTYLIPGRTWSIITICLHSIAALISAITLVISIIVDQSQTIITSSALVLALTTVVLVTYIFAAFVPSTNKMKKLVLISYLPVVALIIGTLLVMSALRLGPALSDENTRENLVATVENIRDTTQVNSSLPSESMAKSLIKGDGITYVKKSSSTYELCATFLLSSDRNYYTNQYSIPEKSIRDSYVTPETFYEKSGKHCFVLTSDALEAARAIDTRVSPTGLFND